MFICILRNCVDISVVSSRPNAENLKRGAVSRQLAYAECHDGVAYLLGTPVHGGMPGGMTVVKAWPMDISAAQIGGVMYQLRRAVNSAACCLCAGIANQNKRFGVRGASIASASDASGIASTRQSDYRRAGLGRHVTKVQFRQI